MDSLALSAKGVDPDLKSAAFCGDAGGVPLTAEGKEQSILAKSNPRPKPSAFVYASLVVQMR